MQRLAVNLVGPAGVVAERGDSLGHGHGLAVCVEHPTFQGFKGCEVLRVALDEIGEFVQEGAAEGARSGFPCGEGLCGAMHGAVNVRWAGGGDGCEWGAGGGVLDGQGLVGGGRGEFIVDEEGGRDCAVRREGSRQGGVGEYSTLDLAAFGASKGDGSHFVF